MHQYAAAPDSGAAAYYIKRYCNWVCEEVAVTDSWQTQREALGAFIRSQRKMANLSLRQLADLTSLSNPYLSQVERGLHEPSVRVLKAISDALNVSAETLLAQAGLVDAVAGAERGRRRARPATAEIGPRTRSRPTSG